jgi:hypothetical protein
VRPGGSDAEQYGRLDQCTRLGPLESQPTNGLAPVRPDQTGGSGGPVFHFDREADTRLATGFVSELVSFFGVTESTDQHVAGIEHVMGGCLAHVPDSSIPDQGSAVSSGTDCLWVVCVSGLPGWPDR